MVRAMFAAVVMIAGTSVSAHRPRLASRVGRAAFRLSLALFCAPLNVTWLGFDQAKYLENNSFFSACVRLDSAGASVRDRRSSSWLLRLCGSACGKRLGQGIDQEGIQADLPSRRCGAHAAVQFDGQPADDLDAAGMPQIRRDSAGCPRCGN